MLRRRMGERKSIRPEESFQVLQTEMQKLQSQIVYSLKYRDSTYVYRHVFLPPTLAKLVPEQHLLSESEWRNLGIQQSIGWEHYMIHDPEPHILLFRKKIEVSNT